MDIMLGRTRPTVTPGTDPAVLTADPRTTATPIVIRREPDLSRPQAVASSSALSAADEHVLSTTGLPYGYPAWRSPVGPNRRLPEDRKCDYPSDNGALTRRSGALSKHAVSLHLVSAD